MNNVSLVKIKRLEEQLFLSNPKLISNDERKKEFSKRLREQLFEGKAVVKIQRIDEECLNLIDSLKQRISYIQDVLSPSKKYKHKMEIPEDFFDLTLSSDSSDDEILSVFVAKKKAEKASPADLGMLDIVKLEEVQEENQIEEEAVENEKEVENEMVEIESQDDLQPTCTSVDTDLPLALRRALRERKSSYKSLSSSSSSLKNVTNTQSVSKKHSKSHGKKHTVSTSDVAYHDKDVIVEEDCDTPHSFNIKIPSLFTRHIHHLRLDSLEFARKFIDYQARQAKQKFQQNGEQQLDCLTNQKKNRSQIKSGQLLNSFRQQEILQQRQEAELSQLIQDVMNDAGNEETLRATTALENINNDLNDNYENIGSLLPLSQSSQDLARSQNSNLGVNNNIESVKKRRKNSKRSNDHQPKEPPKKRGRKPKNIITSLDESPQSQPPTKSNLAKYVEYFANDCEILPSGSQTPAASSTMSQPLVSSTTQNFEFTENQQQQQHLQQIQQQPITTYFIDGDWANGGPCQLVQTTGMTIDAGQINPDAMSAPFQDFVNYIDNNADTGNNVIARVLDNGNSLPIFQNILQPRQLPQQSTQSSLMQPIINIQIPSLSSMSNNTGPPTPPPAHLHKERILDLSVKSSISHAAIISSEVLNLSANTNLISDSSTPIEEDICLPLDLSAKSSSFDPYSTSTSCNHDQSQSHFSVVDNQEDDFIRRLIETSDFNLRPQELQKVCNSTTYDDGKSTKAALDMPLLEFDVPDLDQFVENSTTISDVGCDGQDKLEDNDINIDITKSISNHDSNYVSMNESSSNIINTPFGDDIHFADQSTKEIFDKLLDICPSSNDFSLERITKENNCSFVELDENSFDRNKVQNSTMCETEIIPPNEKAPQNAEETQGNGVKQNKLSSVDKITTNDNKPTMVHKCIPRILKRSLCMKIPPPHNYEKSSDDEEIVVVENEKQSNVVITIENSNEIKKTETNVMIEAATNDDNTNKISDQIPSVVKENDMVEERDKSTKEINSIEVIKTKHNEDISMDNTEILTPFADGLIEEHSSDIKLNTKITENENSNNANCMNKFKGVKDDKDISMDNTEQSPSLSDTIELIIPLAAEDLNVEQSSDVTLNLKNSENENSNNTNNECRREILVDVKDDNNISMDNTEQSTTSLFNRQQDCYECLDINTTESSAISLKIKISENEKSNNESPTKVNVEDMAILKDNAVISTSLSDKHRDCTKAEELNVEQSSNIPLNLKISDNENSNNLNKSDASLNLKMSETDSMENSENSNKSFKLNSPEKSTQSEVSLDLKITESNESNTTNNFVSQIYDIAKITCNNNSLNENYGAIDSIILDQKTENEDVFDTVLSAVPKDTFEAKDSSESNRCTRDKQNSEIFKVSEDTEDDIKSIACDENVSNENISNEKILFSVKKIQFSDNDDLFTDSDSSSRKSYDIQASHHVIDSKPGTEIQVQSNDNPIPSQSIDLQINSVNNENINISMPKLTLLENEDVHKLYKADTNSLYDAAEQDDVPLCLAREIQKKYYLNTCNNEVIDFSVKYDTDGEDNLIIDMEDTQSPMLFRNHDHINEEQRKELTENMEYETAREVTISKEISTSDTIGDNTNETSVENKQTSNSNSLKTADLASLTPLELDSKLEDILDFEEDFDDALSLATSCFDSPNEDRFEESFVETSEPKTQVTNTVTRSIESEIKLTPPKSTSQPKSNLQPSIDSLKNFKIPKKNNTSSAPTEIKLGNEQKANSLTPVSSNLPAVQNIKIKRAFVKLENITRTIKNEIAATGPVNVVQLQQQQPALPPQSSSKQSIKLNFTDSTEPCSSSAIDQQNSRGLFAGLNGESLPVADNIIKLFGITCQPYLVNQCYAITHCPQSHQLNDPETVIQALSSLNKCDLNKAYQYIYNHSNMFKVYFIIFCNLYTSRKDRVKLLNMVNDVERYPDYSEFLIALYEALVKCGLSRVNACRQILKRSREKTTSNIDVLVALIMKSDWTMFTDYIEEYTEEIYKYNFRIGILEQMSLAVLSSKGPQLKQIFGKCVQTLHCEDTGLLLNSPNLIQCVALLTST